MTTLLKIAISLGILYILFESIEPDALGDAFVNVNLSLLVAALFFVLSIRVIMAFRWQIVLKLYGLFPKFFNLLSIVFISNSIGHLLPGGGIDVIRTYQLSKEEGVVADVAASVFVDRIVGLLSMLLIAFFASITGFLFSEVSILYIFVTSAVLIVFLATYSLRTKLAAIKYDALVSSGPFKFVFSAFSKFVTSLSNVPLPKPIVLQLLTLSMAVQLVRIVIFFIIFAALGVHVEWLLFMVFIPLLFIIMLMPVSIGGLGVREGALYLFFNPYGVSLEACTAAGLLFHLLQIISLLPGLFLFLLKKG